MAQKDTVVVIGQKMDGTAMSVPALHFDKSVFTFNFSGDKTNLCVSYRNRSKNGKSWKIQGTISLLNFNEHRELWHRPINYLEERAICTNKGVIVCTYAVNQHYNTFYGKINGRKLWENAGPGLTHYFLVLYIHYLILTYSSNIMFVIYLYMLLLFTIFVSDINI